MIPNPPQDAAHGIPPMVDELSFNYAYLRAFYFYAKEELGPYSAYTAAGSGAAYGDVVSMYAGLSDRFTQYWTPANADAIWNGLTTSGEAQTYIGIEMMVEQTATGKPDKLYVNRLWIDGPAERSGQLRKEDRIIGVNGVALDTDPALKGNALLTKYRDAAAGSEITLTVLRGDTAIVLAPIQKKVMNPPTVYLDYIDEIPVIQITQFSGVSGDNSSTAKEFHTALDRVVKSKEFPLGDHPVGIIDLRGNGGGLINECYACIEEVVAGGVYIRSEEHNFSDAMQIPVIIKTGEQATPGGLGEAIRWIVLADAGSASATEIFLFAVKNCRPETRIFGTKTYGKGIAQYYIPTLANGLAAITAIKYYDANWNTYHEIGITPDEPAANSATALAKAAAYALSIKHPGRSAFGESPAERAAIQALDSRLVERQVPPDGIRGGAWKLLPSDGVR
jgi:C-terminal peptidase prc